MPNGGTDNCGTCSFNKRNKGTTGHLYANVDAPHHCLLRDFQITERSEGFWIYCGNHSQLPNGGIDVPIGPVFKNFSGSSAGERVVVLESPDNSAVRNTLLRFVGSMPVQTSTMSPISSKLHDFGSRRQQPMLNALPTAGSLSRTLVLEL